MKAAFEILRPRSWLGHDPPDAGVIDEAALQRLAQFLGTSPDPARLAARPGRPDGLSGTRTQNMLDALDAMFDGRHKAALYAIADTVTCLVQEIQEAEDSQDQRELSHLRLLHALALGVFARHWAAARNGQRFEDADGRRILRRLTALRPAPWWRRSAGQPPAPSQPGADPVATIAEMAAESARRLPGEAHAHVQQADTLFFLGKVDEALAVLRRLQGTSWLPPKWAKPVQSRIESLQDPAFKLPRATLATRLKAMEQPDWLQSAGDRLPVILQQESGLHAGNAVFPYTHRLVLSVPREYADSDAYERLVGTAADASGTTIAGLRAELREHFGVELPGVNVRDEPMPSGHARVELDGVLVARHPETDVPDQTPVWAGRSDIPPPLAALRRASLRSLDRFPASRPGADLGAETARAILLADREPIDSELERTLGTIGTPAADAASARLRPRRGAALWGGSDDYARYLLPSADEDRMLEIQRPFAVAFDEQRLKLLIDALKARAPQPAAPHAARAPALVVRDPLLRPLLRALLRDDLPDVPVLALAELPDMDLASLDLPA